MEVNNNISNLEIISLENPKDVLFERNVAEMLGKNHRSSAIIVQSKGNNQRYVETHVFFAEKILHSKIFSSFTGLLLSAGTSRDGKTRFFVT